MCLLFGSELRSKKICNAPISLQLLACTLQVPIFQRLRSELYESWWSFLIKTPFDRKVIVTLLAAQLISILNSFQALCNILFRKLHATHFSLILTVCESQRADYDDCFSARNRNILVLPLSVAVCLWGLTCSISEDEAVRIEEECQKSSEDCQYPCSCDDVLRPMFWHEFLPSYLACQADLVCLLTRMRWMTAKGEINASGAIFSFRKANNPFWVARKFFFLENGVKSLLNKD